MARTGGLSTKGTKEHEALKSLNREDTKTAKKSGRTKASSRFPSRSSLLTCTGGCTARCRRKCRGSRSWSFSALR